MPAAKIELNNRNEAQDRIIEFGDGQEHFRVTHEVCNTFQHTSRLEDKGGQYNSAEIGTRS